MAIKEPPTGRQAPAIIDTKSRLRSLQVEPLTCAIGAEIGNVNLGVASRDEAGAADLPAAAQAQGAVLPRPGHHARRARGLRRAFRRARGPPGGRQRPGAPGAGAHLQVARHAQRPLRERLARRRHLAREAAAGLRAALRGVRRPWVATPCGPTWCWPTRSCRSTSSSRSPAARAPQHRGDLRRRHADREAPGAEGAVPDPEHPVVRTHPETGEKVLFVNPSPRTSPTSTRQNVRYGQDYAPGASQLLQYLISQAQIPEYQVRFRWKPEQHGHVGQPLHPALRRHGLPALPSQDGTRRDHRRQALLNTHSHNEDTHELPGRIALSREPGQAGHHRRALRPRVDALGLPRGHRGQHGGPGPEGGGLLQRRRHRAARARARGRRQGLQAPVQVQRAAGRHPRPRARHDPAGGRLDLFAPEKRWRRGQVAVRRHAPHAGRAEAHARPGHDRHQHQPDEHRRADAAQADCAGTSWPPRRACAPTAR